MNTLRYIFRGNAGFVAGLVFVVILSSQRHAGLLMFVVAPLALLYQAVQLLRSWCVPHQRTRRLAACLLVVTAALVTTLVQVHWLSSSRASADDIAQKIERYYVANGRYPSTLADVNVSATDMRRSIHLYYWRKDEELLLSYGSTLVPFDRWHYDFATRKWRYVPD